MIAKTDYYSKYHLHCTVAIEFINKSESLLSSVLIFYKEQKVRQEMYTCDRKTNI